MHHASGDAKRNEKMEKLIAMTQSLSMSNGNGDIGSTPTHRDLINIGFALLSKAGSSSTKLEINNLISKVYQDWVADKFKDSFEPFDPIKVTNEVIDHLTVFVWGGEVYVAIEPEDNHTKAYYLDGTLVTSEFIYNFDDEYMFALGTLTQSTFDELLNSRRTAVFVC